jgi:hypothetical protein
MTQIANATQKSLFAFWSQLSTHKTQFETSLALANLDVPYYLSNAAWFPKPRKLQELRAWYETLKLPAAVIVSKNKSQTLERALSLASFKLERQFLLSELRELRIPSKGECSVEQVSWQQMHELSKLLAIHYEQPQLAFNIGKSLSTAMQNDKRIYAFLSYGPENANPKGGMLVFDDIRALNAMFILDPDRSLEQRLFQEAKALNQKAFVLKELSALSGNSALILERWSVP